MSFNELNLNQNIQKAIDNCGYTTPTPIQAEAIPAIIAGKDIVACAQTGTGKTAAFVLPALQRLSLQKPSRHTKILILTPTRELATQITTAAALYGKHLQFKIVSLVGGMAYHNQIRELSRGADIIVATPGRLLDHIDSQRVDLSQVEMLVLDEADRMLDMGFIDDVKQIANMMSRKRQTLLFSATADKQLGTVVRELLNNPIWIDLSNKEIASPNIKQEVYKASNQQHKIRMLRHFLNDVNIFKAIIFSATKINADKLATQLRTEGYPAAALHGDLRQNVRNRTIEQLRKGKIQFLVATDVAARGIDINDITHVFNYDMPRFCEDYVHRIGRTGRAGKTGTAISFVTSIDAKHLQRIERYIGQRLKISGTIDGAQASERPDHFKPLEDEPRYDSRAPRRVRNNDDSRSGGKSFSSERRRSFGSDDSRTSNKPFSSERRKSFGGDDNRASKPFSSEKRKSFGDDDSRASKPFSSERRKSFGDDSRASKPFSSDKRKSFGDDDSRVSSKPFSSERRKSFGGDDSRGSAKPFSSDRRKSFGDDNRASAKPFSSERRKSFGGDDSRGSAKPFSSEGRKRFGDDDSRGTAKPFERRKSFGGDDSRASAKPFSSERRKSFGGDDSRGSAKPFSSERRKSFGDDSRTSAKPFSSERRKRFGDDDSRGAAKPFERRKSFGGDDSRASAKPFSSERRKSFGGADASAKPFSSEKRSSSKPAFGDKKRGPRAAGGARSAGISVRKKERRTASE